MRYRMIDELVEKVDERNIDEVGKELIGVSVDKCFIKSVANVNGTDLSKYKVIHKNDFAVSLMQVSRDAKIPIARLEEYDVAIMSPAYPIFRVKDTSVVLPEYLEMWFKRPEFDREAAFIAVGGVRGSMPWEEFVKMKLPVPSLDIQKNIVKSYKIIADRIALKQKINDNLEAQAFSIYKDFTRGLEASADLSDIAMITMGTSPEGESFNTYGDGDVFYQGRTDFGFRFPTIRLFTTEGKRYAKAGDVLMSVRAPVGDVNLAKEGCAIGRGLASIRPKDGCYSFLYYTMQELNFELKKFNDEGTVFGSITKDDLFTIKIISLDSQKRKDFERIVAPIDALIKANEYEISKLQELRETFISSISRQ